MSANEAQRSEARTSPVATTTSRRISAANTVFALRSTSFRSALIAGETSAFPVAELFFSTDSFRVARNLLSIFSRRFQRFECSASLESSGRKILFFPLELKLDWIWVRNTGVVMAGIERRINLSDHWPLWTILRVPPERDK